MSSALGKKDHTIHGLGIFWGIIMGLFGQGEESEDWSRPDGHLCISHCLIIAIYIVISNLSLCCDVTKETP
jgi:hypothetical protein